MTKIQATEIAPDLLRITAPNAGPYTAAGTNTYVLGAGSACVIDPGPADERHIDAVLRVLGKRRASHIVVTHAHLDHSALAPALAAATGAPVLAWGDAAAGRRADLAALGGGQGADAAFRPDRAVPDGEVIEGEDWRLVALHTPGHMGNHLCLDRGDVLFTGDHAMGWSTSLVSPPDGDMGAYMASTERLLSLGPRRLLPGHGEAVADGAGRLRALLAHRHAREAEILQALGTGPGTAGAIAQTIYAGIEGALLLAAERTVLAHLVDLRDRGLATSEGVLRPEARFHRTAGPWTAPEAVAIRAPGDPA